MLEMNETTQVIYGTAINPTLNKNNNRELMIYGGSNIRAIEKPGEASKLDSSPHYLFSKQLVFLWLRILVGVA